MLTKAAIIHGGVKYTVVARVIGLSVSPPTFYFPAIAYSVQTKERAAISLADALNLQLRARQTLDRHIGSAKLHARARMYTVRGTMILIKRSWAYTSIPLRRKRNETYTPSYTNAAKHTTYMYTNYNYNYYYSGYIRILKVKSARARALAKAKKWQRRENYFLEYCTQINTREKERQNESDVKERERDREKRWNEINYRSSKVIIFYIFLCNFVDAR